MTFTTSDQQYRAYTGKQETDKAIHTLKGILTGIALDGIINEHETTELRLWVQHNLALSNQNPIKEFVATISAMLADGIPSAEAVEDLNWLIQSFESDSYYYNGVTTDIQILQGICHGILADGEVSDDEIFALDKWLDENTHLNSYYPYDEISSLVLSITRDKRIDEQERLELMAFFKQFSNIKHDDVRSYLEQTTYRIPINGICTTNPDIVFAEKKFCFTGLLKNWKRADAHNHVHQLGGIAMTKVSSGIDYLIVGDTGNQAWAYSCYGRKVEEAIKMRKDGHRVSIIHEFDFKDALLDAGVNT